MAGQAGAKANSGLYTERQPCFFLGHGPGPSEAHRCAGQRHLRNDCPGRWKQLMIS